jgi:hypothetical protein
MRHAFPGFGEELLARIGPRVGIVVVEQKMITQFLGVFGERDGVFEIVGQFRRVYEKAAGESSCSRDP